MSLAELTLLILVYNAVTFGDGPVMVPVLQQSLVDERGVLTSDQLLYAFTIARLTPGQANVYVASVGYFLHGLPGALLATLAMQVPGYAVLPLLRWYRRLAGLGAVAGFTRGLRAASVALIFAATLSIGRRTLASPAAWVAFGLTVLLVRRFDVRPAVALALATAAGVAVALVSSILGGRPPLGG